MGRYDGAGDDYLQEGYNPYSMQNNTSLMLDNTQNEVRRSALDMNRKMKEYNQLRNKAENRGDHNAYNVRETIDMPPGARTQTYSRMSVESGTFVDQS